MTADARDLDVLERTYAGVLGKMAGVYLGRPVEGWPPERIEAVHGRSDDPFPGAPTVVSDDDLSGAFTFVRALEDHRYPEPLTPAQVGETWLDHLIEGKTTLWWGGMGSSTEHTAFLRLRSGLRAPDSGRAATNGPRLAEQIGGRIFADAWGLVHPGDPTGAARDARAAAQVSHDGVAVDAAGMLAATVAAAFDGRGVASALDRGRSELPIASPLHDLIDEVEAAWREADGWRAARDVLAARHPYARYGGFCPLVPNEAVVLLALTAAPDDLVRALTIAIGCGLDTDCNAGNVGAVIGVALGLDAFASPTARAWREAMNDRLFVVAAEGGEAVTDALTVARRLHGYARRHAGDAATDGRPRFDFPFRGATQGFSPAPGWRLVAAGGGTGLVVEPIDGAAVRSTTRAWTPTAIQRPERTGDGYGLIASPTLYPGQTLSAVLRGAGLRARPFVEVEAPGDGAPPFVARGPEVTLGAGPTSMAWQVPFVPGPIVRVGIESVDGIERPEVGAHLRLDSLTWTGAPRFELRPADLEAWRDAWLIAFDHVHVAQDGGLAFAHDRAGGWASIGGRSWRDVRVEARLEPPHDAPAALFVRGRGARRRVTLSVAPGAWTLEAGCGHPPARGRLSTIHGTPVVLSLEAVGDRVRAWLDGEMLAEVQLGHDAAPSGAAGIVGGPGTVVVRSFSVATADAAGA